MKQLVEGCNVQEFTTQVTAMVTQIHALRESVAATGSECSQRLIDATVDLQCAIGCAVNERYGAYAVALSDRRSQ